MEETKSIESDALAKQTRKFTIGMCPNCSEHFLLAGNTPHLLPCGHSICAICIHIRTEGRNMCLLCKREFTLEDAPYIAINYAFRNTLKKIKDYVFPISLDNAINEMKDQLIIEFNRMTSILYKRRNTLCRIMGVQMNIIFWNEELKNLQAKMRAKQEMPDVVDNFKRGSNLLPKLDKMLTCYDQKLRSFREEQNSFPKQTRKVWSGKNVPVLKALENLSKDIYASALVDDEQMFFKLSPGEGFIHLHSGFLAECVDEDYIAKLETIETSLNLSKAVVLFVDFCFKTNLEEMKKRIYINVEKDKNDFVKKVISLFIGRPGKASFKGSIVHKKPQALVISESLDTPSLFHVPSTSCVTPIRKINYLEQAMVVGYREAEGVNLFFVTNNRAADKSGLPLYFGKVISGIYFLMHNSSNSGIVEDCGIVLGEYDFE